MKVVRKSMEDVEYEFGESYGRYESLNWCSEDLCLNLEAHPIARKTSDLKDPLAYRACSLAWEHEFNLIAFL